MREDPIIFEDWRIAPFDEKTLTLISRIDVSLSFLMAILGMSLGIALKEEYLFLIWLFYFFLSIFVDLLILQTNFSILNKLLSFSILLGIIYLSLNNSETNVTNKSALISTQIISLLLSVLVTLKFIFLLVSDITWSQVGDVLRPKTPKIDLKLKNHYSMLQNTNFKISNEVEIRKNVYSSFVYIIIYSIQAIILALILLGSRKIGIYLVENYDNYLNTLGILLILLGLIMFFVLWVIPVLLISEFIRIYLVEKKGESTLFLKIKSLFKRKSSNTRSSFNEMNTEYFSSSRQERRNLENIGVDK